MKAAVEVAVLTPVLCAARDLSPPGTLLTQQAFQAEFANVEMQYDSHRGIQVRLRCVPYCSFCLLVLDRPTIFVWPWPRPAAAAKRLTSKPI